MRLALGFCGPFAKAAFSSRSVRKRRAGRHVEVRRGFFYFYFPRRGAGAPEALFFLPTPPWFGSVPRGSRCPSGNQATWFV